MSESLTSLINGTLKTLMANKEYDAVIEKCNVALDQYPKSATLYIERFVFLFFKSLFRDGNHLYRFLIEYTNCTLFISLDPLRTNEKARMEKPIKMQSWRLLRPTKQENAKKLVRLNCVGQLF